MYNWSLLTIAYQHFITSVTVTITTNNPSHLFMYWTDVKPVRHKDSRLLRGVLLPWGAYFCFVAWNIIEQSEPGDTLTHTFIVPDWSYCQTRYFTFIGTVDSNDSPSIAPLFTHHHSGEPPFLTEEQLIGIHYSVTYGNGEWGQRLIITNRLVSKLSFKLEKTGSPTGDLVFKIRRVSDGSIIVQKVLDAANVPSSADWMEATFDTPSLINEEARILVTLVGGNVFNCVKVYASWPGDVKPGEWATQRSAGGVYTDHPHVDFTYIYTYQQY